MDMDLNDSPGLLKSVLGFFARRAPERSTPLTSLKSQTSSAWVRTDAYLQHETNDFDDINHEQIAKTLRTFESLVQYDLDRDRHDQSSYHTAPYPKLQAVRSMMRRPSHEAQPAPSIPIRISKRKREIDAAIEELSHLDKEAKKRRVLPREDPNVVDNVEEPEADFAMMLRKHSVLLHHGLRTQWTCICQKCSGLSVRLSLPQRKKGTKLESCFEVFFGVRSLLAITLQEAKITVKDVQNGTAMSTSVMPDFAHICQSITESLDQRNCLHLLFEDGSFKRLRPQPKTFDDSHVPRTVSLSALFKRQQDLRGGSSALPLKGKRILAVTLATALLPFLETPWVQPSFDNSKIHFFQPLQDGELPNITKPFLAMEHIPIISARKMDTRNDQADSTSFKHMVHPNASVLALGILLCELHYCLPVESWRKDTENAQNVNTNYYTSLEILKNLEVDAGVDYYLATKACLQWEYYPSGEPADFESVSVQRLFYQNVVKRLESEIFKSWHLRLEDLESLGSHENELCWGLIGREVVRQQTSRREASSRSNEELAVSLPSTASVRYSESAVYKSDVALQNPTQYSWGFQNRPHPEVSTTSLYFFDASHQSASGQDTGLSERWINNLLASIYHHVDPSDAIMQTSTTNLENRIHKLKPVRIAILDTGFDPGNLLLMDDNQRIDSRIKEVRNFVPQTELFDIQDEIGHGTHALGLILKVAICAEVYIAKVANRETLGRDSYDTIAKAIAEWNVDIISMSFGIREYHEPMKTAIVNALHNQTLMFAAASNDGANLGRAFPAKYPGVFCIHSTDGNGNPSAFNPTADEKDVNFSLLGEHVVSHWPAGKNGHNDIVNVMSGTSVATPIAAGLAASVLSFVRQQELGLSTESERLGPWLKDVHSMDAVLKSMVRQRRGQGYDYITPHVLFDTGSSREHIYNKIRDIKRHMYD
ncbi:hypothetical protein K491DRAFT_600940 [Lophiostoma macrostomum CBS 122681]|uniref:Uncharacterized protein n=1 Tax=Lophiostoma macrostomum CBS 122681 TaxID=1314788 RepID=A0A6A6T589_9PLEO|nr:hypothetical protein K491DRAFT_600940 [Lophiostoma macrostomum CBS 122681]